MTKSTSKSAASQIQWTPQRIKLALILCAVLLVYLLLRPTLQSVLGVSLPGVFPEDPVVNADRAAPDDPGKQNASNDVLDLEKELAQSDRKGTAPPTEIKTDRPTPKTPRESAVPSARPPDKARPAVEATALGELTELGRERFRSTAGLIYVPTRSEHRIDHVMRHARNDPERPVHGVFWKDDRAVVLGIIDEAYQIARKGKPPQVETEDDGDRTVYIIDMGRKIGYMGGQAGARRRNPPCKHLQLVLEGNEVITAYPVIPR